MICEHIKNLCWNSWPILSGHKSGHKIGQGPWNFITLVTDRLTPMYQNFMDLIHELCPVQLLEVTKKRDILSVWLASIQHLAHINRLTAHPSMRPAGGCGGWGCWWGPSRGLRQTDNTRAGTRDAEPGRGWAGVGNTALYTQLSRNIFGCESSPNKS
jgi:hypothetical protein